ncbi:MAG: hypothetical protein DWB56_06765 [Candidatus Jettenia sp.]|uniref:Lipoprotein n=1 Tax=Candidatus Jettenia caeni TaxID=247490 RepID=I3IN00_9BACT|nr:hypothetical protein [Candidatus Jettenia sp. AMX1]MBC6928655.1 hypothetical protein [Candidatus Jettenia sp.]GAB63095.1 hypothetical protein KSU1_C1499 [Candidatus Jettenia caeni]KAA0250633.1 MAG: hypothetical protein EDM77_03705 [Candidatus Jettenia sp. AMX1]MCE7879967.1 hypothetical protein [Candidatus Jettenia sp. AMX1]MCQ3926749.1 hypothetical protein [Candidatus Jettenia sp.]
MVKMKWVFIGICVLSLSMAGCSFLDAVRKKDAKGNPYIEAKGTAFLRTAQGVARIVGETEFPVVGAVASGIASLCGIGITIANNAARKRAKALEATVVGVNAITNNYKKIEDAVLAMLNVAGQNDMSQKIKEIFLQYKTPKQTVQKLANKKGIENYLYQFIRKIERKYTMEKEG